VLYFECIVFYNGQNNRTQVRTSSITMYRLLKFKMKVDGLTS